MQSARLDEADLFISYPASYIQRELVAQLALKHQLNEAENNVSFVGLVCLSCGLLADAATAFNFQGSARLFFAWFTRSRHRALAPGYSQAY